MFGQIAEDFVRKGLLIPEQGSFYQISMSFVSSNPKQYYFVLVISTENVEADAFFCFTNLMSEIRDNFIKTLDDSACGIGEF